ncbi:MAG: hypothetical protein LBK41_02515 [Clostridiales bacterium]|jgi:hypothetical protein|nr:hypothetical protein [Clostridiales bacterium]
MPLVKKELYKIFEELQKQGVINKTEFCPWLNGREVRPNGAYYKNSKQPNPLHRRVDGELHCDAGYGLHGRFP